MEPVTRLLDTWSGARRAPSAFPAVDDATLLWGVKAEQTEDACTSPISVAALLTEGGAPGELVLPPLAPPQRPTSSSVSFLERPSVIRAVDDSARAFMSTVLAQGRPSLSEVVAAGAPASSAPLPEASIADRRTLRIGADLVSILAGPPSLERAIQGDDEEEDDEAEEEEEEEEEQ